jgi:hypothetical protein
MRAPPSFLVSVLVLVSAVTPISVAVSQDSWVNVMPEGYVVVGTNTVNVTIEWCSRPPHMFDPNTRVIRLNNVDVSANFTTQYVNDVQDCLLGPNQADEIMERSTGTITLTCLTSTATCTAITSTTYHLPSSEG